MCIFIAGHSRVEKEKLEQMMINTGMLTKDLGTILVGKEAVRQGLIDEVGGISAALEKLRSLMLIETFLILIRKFNVKRRKDEM